MPLTTLEVLNMQVLRRKKLVDYEDKNVWLRLAKSKVSDVDALKKIQSMFFSNLLSISSYRDRAGQSLVLHKDSPRQEAWNRLKDSNPIIRSFVSMRQAYDESENPVVSSMRSVTQTIGSWFDENETARVQRLMKMLDPAFNHESFERELREYIVPEVVDAYLSADQEALKAWCGEAVCKLSKS